MNDRTHLYTLEAAATEIANMVHPRGGDQADVAQMRAVTAKAWTRAMLSAMREGNLTCLSGDTWIPVDPNLPGATVAFVVERLAESELNRWLTSLGVPVELKWRSPPAERMPNEKPIPWARDPYWKQMAHSEATRIAQRNFDRGYGGTGHRDVMADVTSVLKEMPDFPKNVSPERIRRTVLAGWKWEPTIISPTARAALGVDESGASGAPRQ